MPIYEYRLHQVPEALQRRAIDQRARQAAFRLPEMQVAAVEPMFSTSFAKTGRRS